MLEQHGIERAILFATLFAIMLPLQASLGPVGIALFNVPLFVLLVLWSARSILGPGAQKVIGVTPWEMLLLLLLFWMGAATALGGTDSFHFKEFTRWASAFPLALYATRNEGKTYGFRLLVRLAVVVVLVQGVVSVTQFLTNSKIGMVAAYFGQAESTQGLFRSDTSLGGARVVGTLGQPNLVANWINLALPFLYLMFSDRVTVLGWRRQAGYFLLWWLGIVVLVLSLSRWNMIVALIVLVGVSALWWLGGRGKFLMVGRRFRRLGRWALAGTVVVVVLFLAGEAIVMRASHINEVLLARLSGTDTAAGLREATYRWAAVTVFRHPFFGVGFGNSDSIWWPAASHVPSMWKYRVHDIFLLFGSEGGVPAIIFFVLLVFSPLVRYFRHLRAMDARDDILAIGVMIYLLTASLYVLPVEHALWPFFLFLLGTFKARVDRAIFWAKETGVGMRACVPEQFVQVTEG